MVAEGVIWEDVPMKTKKSQARRIISVLLLAAVVALGLHQNQSGSWNDSDERFAVTYPAEGIRVACVGDSNTQGGLTQSRMEQSYPAVLGQLLHGGYVVGNFGLYGSAATRENDNPYFGSNAHAHSLAFQPEIVIIMLGSNDSPADVWDADTFAEDYKALIETYRDLDSEPRIILATLIPAYADSFGVQPALISGEIPALIREIGEELSLEVVDVYTPFVDEAALYLSDRVHLTEEGKAKLASVMFEAIDW